MKIHLDFETYSELDLRKVGAWMYSKHASTEVICMSYAVDDEQPVLWLPEYPAPARLMKLLNDPSCIVAAWNSFFEWCIWHHTLQWDGLPLSQWEDTMAKAAAHNLPLSLDKCGYAMQLDADKLKSKRGKYLIDKLCKPQKGFRLYDRVLLRELYDYCKQDVIAERAISKKLPPLIPSEQKLWILDQTINIRGTYIDVESCTNALAILEQMKRILQDEAYQATDTRLASTNSRPQVLKYLEETCGYKLDGYTKNDIKKALKDPALPETARKLLEIRQREGKTSTSKYGKLAIITDHDDNRAHGLLQYHAASTGRWGGRMFQPHNLPRPDKALAPLASSMIESFKFRSPEVLEMLYGEPMECMSTALRGMIISPPNRLLYVGDYNQIEARVLVWLAQQLDVLKVFISGQDVYRHTASKIFNMLYADIDKESLERFVGKIATLALGYQGGYKAFVKMAADNGMDDFQEDEAEQIKIDWRASNDQIVKLWYALETAAVNAVRLKGVECFVEHGLRNLSFIMGKHWLHLRLPSGRELKYFHPSITGGNEGFDTRQLQVRYWGTDSFTKQWTQIEMYGGKWAQHVCEGISRDLLALAMQDLEDNTFEMVLSVHDENVAEAEHGRMNEFKTIMKRKPDWATGLPVDVDCFAERRYRK